MRFTNTQFWFLIILWISISGYCVWYISNTPKPFNIGLMNNPASESGQAKDLTKKIFPYNSSHIIILFKSKLFITNDAQFENGVKKSLDGLKNLAFDYRVTSPYDNSKQISSDKHAAYAVLQMKKSSEEIAKHMEDIKLALGTPKNLKIFIGGEPSYIADVYPLSEDNLVRAELIALPLSFIAMVFIFGGILSALLPVISALISIPIIIAILYFIGTKVELTVFVLNIATMLGLGLCLDYTLLLTYRYREEIYKNPDCKIAIKKTLMTAGKSIFFSGLTVLISIASLLFFKLTALYSIGIGGIVVVIVSVMCSLTFLPALLCIIEKKLNAFSIPLLKPLPTEESHKHGWYRFAMYVMRHPFLFLIPTTVFLLFLGAPFLDVKLGSANAKILPTWIQSRQLMDEFSKSFNESEMAPISIILESKKKSMVSKENIGELYDFVNELKKDKRVDRVGSIVTLKNDFTKKQYQRLYASKELPLSGYQKDLFTQSTKDKFTTLSVVSKYPEGDQRTIELVKKIRETNVGKNITKKVSGTSATIIDTIDIIYKKFFNIVIIISLITYVVLVILLRSLILPFKAILMNFLSLSVCYGMLVYIFQEGHFAKLLNFTPLGYTEVDLPILLFFGLFGLSMDYEVFLLTRIKEFYDETHDNTKSVAYGLERSARIITSAALVLVIVSAAFVTADIIFIKAFGLGTALAIAIDASFVRLLLVPATMRLLGNWNWYIPKWLDRILPDVKLE